MKAFSYLRVSGKGQVEGDGFDRQRDAIAKRAKTDGFEVVREFIDAGISGTKDLDERPALSDLFAVAPGTPPSAVACLIASLAAAAGSIAR